MNLNKFLGLFLMVGVCLLLFSACQKEETVETIPFIKEAYQPTETVDVKEVVTNFIGYVKQANDYKTAFRNTEVNEGMWLMEAAFNYLYNRNLRQKTVETRDYEISIQSVNASGKLEMQGSDMTAQFEVLEKRMTAYAEKKGLVLKLIDFEIKSTNKQQTQLIVRGVYGDAEAARLSGSKINHCGNWYDCEETIQAAGERMEECINESIQCSSNMGNCWFSSVNLLTSIPIAPSVAGYGNQTNNPWAESLYYATFLYFPSADFVEHLEDTRSVIDYEVEASNLSDYYTNVGLAFVEVSGDEVPSGVKWIQVDQIVVGYSNGY